MFHRLNVKKAKHFHNKSIYEAAFLGFLEHKCKLIYNLKNIKIN